MEFMKMEVVFGVLIEMFDVYKDYHEVVDAN